METELKFVVPLSYDAQHLCKRLLTIDPAFRAQMPEIKTHRSRIF